MPHYITGRGEAEVSSLVAVGDGVGGGRTN